MTTALTIGRVGLDVELADVEEIGFSGDQLRLAGVLIAATLGDVKVLRQQLMGYVDNGDEEVVPVTWEVDSHLDGFYRVLSVDVSTVPASYTANWFQFSVGLERVPGYAGPLMETVVVGAVRTNSHSITSTNAVAAVGVPDAAAEFYDTANPAPANVFTRTSAEGDVRVTQSATYTRTLQFALDPKDWYVGSARIEVGTNYRAAVGQQIHAETQNWRLSNGLIRVRPVSNGFGMSVFDAGIWSPEKVFTGTFDGSSGGPIVLATGLRILRNSPEEVIVRLPVALGATLPVGTGSARVDIDLAIRRGERTMRVFLASTFSASWGVEVVTAEAATALTGGIRATSNDANGNRFVLATPQAVTNDLTQGGFALTAGATTFAYAAGIEVNGSTAPAVDAAQQLIYQYMAAHSERTVVASR